MGKKHDIMRGCASVWKTKLKNYRYELIEDVVDKLGELEDLEEDLGIDLITLFKILKSENIYANGKRYDNSNSLSYMGNSWLIFNHQAKQGFRFKDYGKTWALTKEKLECQDM